MTVRPDRLVLTAAAAVVALAASAFAQSDRPPARQPEEGIAILDCDPGAPAPAESCVLRVPPGMERDGLRSRTLGTAEDGERASFEFVRQGDSLFPDDVVPSATILLIDLTPGPGRGRVPTFEQEKALIRAFAETLPRGEPIAVYGFHENLQRLMDFSTDRDDLRDTLDALEIQGVNTRIATHALDAIERLAARDDVLFRNLVVISDGDEEGIDALDEVAAAAREANVVISSVGLFWQPLGTPATAQGMDYLERLAEGALGAFQPVQIRRDDARGLVEAFGARLSTSHRQSGLIVPTGAPRASVISVSLSAPSPVASDRVESRELSVTFAPSVPEPAPEPPVLSTLALSLLGGSALLAALGLVVFARARRKAPEHEEAADAADDAAPGERAEMTGIGGGTTEPPAEEGPTRLVPSASARPIAYLVREDSGERLPITGPRTAVGRGRDNAVVLAGDSISRVHAEIHRNRDDGFSVTDMDSLNGTFVNDAKVSGTRQVRGGDTIRFGDVRMRLVLA